MPNKVLIPLLILQLSCLAAFNLYSLAVNATNHTGFPLHFLMAVLFLSLLPAAVAMLRERRARPLSLLVLAAGLLGIANIWLFQRFGVMLPYEEWLRRGMP